MKIAAREKYSPSLASNAVTRSDAILTNNSARL